MTSAHDSGLSLTLSSNLSDQSSFEDELYSPGLVFKPEEKSYSRGTWQPDRNVLQDSMASALKTNEVLIRKNSFLKSVENISSAVNNLCETGKERLKQHFCINI
jgi:hypothetical protein